MEKMLFNKLGVMIDCSRNSVMNITSLKDTMKLLKKMGYNTIQLYTEDTYEVDNEPYFGYLRGRYTKDEMKELDNYAQTLDMELIPCVQTLAHLDKIFRWQPYWGINDTADILLAEDERTYELLDNIFKTLRECYTSKRVNIGMDEAHLLGLGKYMHLHGYKNRVDIIMTHLKKVLEIAEKYNFRCMMWSDMFFRLAFGGEYYIKEEKDMPKEILDKVPSNLDLVYWDYYSNTNTQYKLMAKCFKKFNNNIIFASGAWSWQGLVPINRFGISSNKAAIKEIINAKIDEMFVTCWGDDGGTCSIYSVLPTLFYVSCLAKGINKESDIKKRFKEEFGISFNDYMEIDSLNVLVDNQEPSGANPSKYLLYNDALLGMFDSTIDNNVKESYLKHELKLKKLAKNQTFGFVFKPIEALNKVLINKADLGLRIRNAYKNKDKEQMKEIICTLNVIDKDLKKFYQEIKVYWHKIYKPNGFEVIDYRIGGLIFRLNHVKNILSDYANGNINEIELLNEDILDYLGGLTEFKKKPIGYNGFRTNATVNGL